MFSLRIVRASIITLAVASSAVLACKSGTSDDASSSPFVVTTPQVTIAASSEKYLCWSVTLDRDLAVDKFDYAPNEYVHHMFFSRASVAEPEGLSECNVVFKTTWVPLFLSGKGGTSLAYPDGDANVLTKGTQVVLQMHLLNPTAVDKSFAVSLQMHESTTANPTPVGLYAFGTTKIDLPPTSTTSVTNECTTSEDVTSFAMFAHEHQLGTKVTLETMDASGNYKTVYTRDPYDFNNQVVEQIPLSIPKGTKTRITCSYANSTSSNVTYGESSYNEMCYLALFVPGTSGANGCVGGGETSDGGAGTSDGGTCTPTANALGIGAPCTGGGSQCGSGLSCSSDLSSAAGANGFCVKVGCNATADCGSDATCCAPAQSGGAINVCLPSSCVPSDCAVRP